MSARGTTNRNARGGAADRRARKQWLLDTFGDGTSAECALQFDARCLGRVTLATIQVDRVDPGCHGGGYARSNIRPACGPCNSRHGTAIREARRLGIDLVGYLALTSSTAHRHPTRRNPMSLTITTTAIHEPEELPSDVTLVEEYGSGRNFRVTSAIETFEDSGRDWRYTVKLSGPVQSPKGKD